MLNTFASLVEALIMVVGVVTVIGGGHLMAVAIREYRLSSVDESWDPNKMTTERLFTPLQLPAGLVFVELGVAMITPDPIWGSRLGYLLIIMGTTGVSDAWWRMTAHLQPPASRKPPLHPLFAVASLAMLLTGWALGIMNIL